MLENAPVKYDGKVLPKEWADSRCVHIGSRSHQTDSYYRTPKYVGHILWEWNEFYGDLAAIFVFDGKELHSVDGHELYKVLGVPEDFCTRTGKDGWMKMLPRTMFEQWLRTDVDLSWTPDGIPLPVRDEGGRLPWKDRE